MQTRAGFVLGPYKNCDVYLVRDIQALTESNYAGQPKGVTDDSGMFDISYYGQFTGFLVVPASDACYSILTGEPLQYSLVSMVTDDMAFSGSTAGAVVSPLTTLVAAIYVPVLMREGEVFPPKDELELIAANVATSLELDIPEGATLFDYNPLQDLATASAAEKASSAAYLLAVTRVNALALSAGAFFSTACSYGGDTIYPVEAAVAQILQSVVEVVAPPQTLDLTKPVVIQAILQEAQGDISTCPLVQDRRHRRQLLQTSDVTAGIQALSTAVANINKEAASLLEADSAGDLIGAFRKVSVVAATNLAPSASDLGSGTLSTNEFEDDFTTASLATKIEEVSPVIPDWPFPIDPPSPQTPESTPVPVVDEIDKGDWYFWSTNVIICVAVGGAVLLCCVASTITASIFLRRGSQTVKPFSKEREVEEEEEATSATPLAATPEQGSPSPGATSDTALLAAEPSPSTYYKMGPPQPGMTTVPGALRSPQGDVDHTASQKKQKEADARVEFENILKEQQDYIARRLNSGSSSTPGAPPSPPAQPPRPGVGSSLPPLASPAPGGVSPTPPSSLPPLPLPQAGGARSTAAAGYNPNAVPDLPASRRSSKTASHASSH